jgi:hypothetical protein
MTIAIERPAGAQAAQAPAPGPQYQPSGLAAEAPAEGKTALRRTCRNCPATLGARNRTGLCRICVRDHTLRPLTVKQQRDREPNRMIRAAMRTLAAAARRAAEEDPGEGLAALVEATDLLRDITRETGIAVVANLGSTVTAAELTERTGRDWSRQRVEDRWIPARREGAQR